MTDITELLSDEADLCRNDGAEDIAALLDAAKTEIETLRAALLAERERNEVARKAIIGAENLRDDVARTIGKIAGLNDDALTALEEPT